MAKHKTLADSPFIAKATLDPAETAPALGKGQPVLVTKWPTDSVADPYVVKTCPDGQVPDFVVGRSAVSGGPGDVLFLTAGAPALLGGGAKRGELLTVKGGRFVKGVAGDVCVCAASQDGVAGDVIAAQPVSKTV